MVRLQLTVWALVLSSVACNAQSSFSGPYTLSSDVASFESDEEAVEEEGEDDTVQDTHQEMVERAREYGAMLGEYVRNTDSLSKVEARTWVNRMSGWMTELNREADILYTSGQIGAPEYVVMQEQMANAVNEGVAAPPAWEGLGGIPDGFYSEPASNPKNPVNADSSASASTEDEESKGGKRSENQERSEDIQDEKLEVDALAPQPGPSMGYALVGDGGRRREEPSTASSAGNSGNTGNAGQNSAGEAKGMKLSVALNSDGFTQSGSQANRGNAKKKAKRKRLRPKSLLDSLARLNISSARATESESEATTSARAKLLPGHYVHGLVAGVAQPARWIAGRMDGVKGHLLSFLVERVLAGWLLLLLLALVARLVLRSPKRRKELNTPPRYSAPCQAP